MKFSYSYISHLLVSLFLFLLPTQLGTYFFFDFSYIKAIRTDYLAPALFLSDIIALILIGLNYKRVYDIFKKRWTLTIVGLLVINVLFSLQVWVSLYKLAKIIEWIALFSIFYSLGSAKDTKEKIPWKLYLGSLFAGTLLEFSLSLAQFINKHTLQGIFYWFGERAISVTTPDAAVASLNGNLFLRPYGTFSHPNSMAGFFLLLYFFVQGWVPFKTNTHVRTATLFFSMLIVFLTFSKTAIVVFLLLNLLIFMQAVLKMKCRFCGIARVIVLVIIAGVFYVPQGDPDSMGKRIMLIDNALQIIGTGFVFGVGLGNYVLVQSLFPNPYSSYFLQPVHNIILLWLAETGLVIGGIILALFTRRVIPLLGYKAFLFCFLAVFLTGMMDHYWLTLQQNILLTAVVFGLLSGKARSIIGTSVTNS